MAHALIHILGSRAGYTTLDATLGLSAADRAELEVLGFGDATSSEAMQRLETHASMVGRRLRSGRFAISRMMPGGIDDKGRPTIEIVSLVLDAAGYASAANSLARLAEDARIWQLARGAVARGYELSSQPSAVSARDPAVLRAFDTWISARKVGAIGVISPQDAAGLLAMIGVLDAGDFADCRWGIGVVSLSAPVDVCTLAPATGAIGSRAVVRAATGEAWLSPEMAYVEAWVGQNLQLPPRLSLVTAVRIEPALDAAPTTSPIQRGNEPVVAPPALLPRRNTTAIAGLSAAASLAILALTTTVYVRTGRVANVAVAAGFDAAATATPEPPVNSGANSGGYGGIALEPQAGAQTIIQPGGPQIAPTPAPPVAPTNAGKSLTVIAPPVAQETEEAIHGCQPGEKWVQLYKDSDQDGLGDEAAEFACVLQGSDKVDEELRSRHLALRAGDQCPNNKDRTKPGKCGCEYMRAAEDCEKDDDGDGETNLTDGSDDRLELLAGVKDELALALRSMQDAQRVHDSIREQLREPLAKREASRIELNNSLSTSRANLETCLDYVYRARLLAVFGEPRFKPKMVKNPKLVAADALRVASEADLKDLFQILEEFPAAFDEFMQFIYKIQGAEETRTNAIDASRDGFNKRMKGRYGDALEPKVCEWVASFIGMKPKQIEKEQGTLRNQCGVKLSKAGKNS